MSIADTTTSADRPGWLALDKLGVLIALIAAAGAALPFALFRANRIVLGEPRSLLDALPGFASGLMIGVLVVGFVTALLRFPVVAKLVSGFLVLAVLFVSVGWAGFYLTPEGDTFARVSPGAGFWLLVFAFALLVTDALTRLHLAPLIRIGILLAVGIAAGILLWSGNWNDLSILKEYATRAPAFWAEARTHLALAFGSVAIATVVGVPLGIVCYKVRPLRAAVLNVLNIVQTIPSIALFGLLIAPLAWVAANVPGASAIGISGIGAAPAMVALFAYSLLPIVSNTVVGLQSVSPAAVDAARGMGMTGTQRLAQVELPLAFPVILTGIRIVLVQNIGLATIAALIGGGGFGVFVFQGIGQTAMDLVLLGAVPTVALAFAAAVVLDALVEMTSRGGRSP
ncbi:ABC transporter permease subunit [Devosia oryziradicis]|uniref:ABC transporter permease subunit n=1 Tax=Devosia oryziradicis TaxID=2801335 RepID=A0ABX7BXD8_9HYPH|nr:ABC transporter permease [Devosia oryziradicis]QQR35709.1 ABC transporter permease subunit [Devosia oryziradicis]